MELDNISYYSETVYDLGNTLYIQTLFPIQIVELMYEYNGS